MSADILPFLKDRSFDSAATAALGEAYDIARSTLRDRGQPQIVQEVIAKRIIDIAMTGERDPRKLAERALEMLGIADSKPGSSSRLHQEQQQRRTAVSAKLPKAVKLA